MDQTKDEPCLACKVTAICCLFSIGGYLIKQARSQPRNSKYPLFALGAGSIALGFGEIFDRSPFRNYKDNT